VTRLTPEAQTLVTMAGEAWVAHKIRRQTALAELRAKLAAEMEEQDRRSALRVGEALRRAIDGGATQSALREVTTRDFRTFKAYRDFDGMGDVPLSGGVSQHRAGQLL